MGLCSLARITPGTKLTFVSSFKDQLLLLVLLKEEDGTMKCQVGWHAYYCSLSLTSCVAVSLRPEGTADLIQPSNAGIEGSLMN